MTAFAVTVRPIPRGGLAGLFRRKPSTPPEPALTLGPGFFAVLERVPEGWTRTLDALPSATEEIGRTVEAIRGDTAL